MEEEAEEEEAALEARLARALAALQQVQAGADAALPPAGDGAEPDQVRHQLRHCLVSIRGGADPCCSCCPSPALSFSAIRRQYDIATLRGVSTHKIKR